MLKNSDLEGGPRSAELILFGRFMLKIVIALVLMLLALIESEWKVLLFNLFEIDNIYGNLGYDVGQIIGWSTLPMGVLLLEYYYFRKRYTVAFIIVLIVDILIIASIFKLPLLPLLTLFLFFRPDVRRYFKGSKNELDGFLSDIK